MIDRRLILSFWSIQLPSGIYGVYNNLRNLLINTVLHANTTVIIWDVTQTTISFIGLILLSAEISKYKNGHLRPEFLTLSNGFRAFGQTIDFVHKIYLRHKYHVSFSSALCALYTLELISFYAGFFYGCWIWYLMNSKKIDESDLNGHFNDDMSLVPRRILLASNLRSKYNTVSKIVNWIYRPTVKINRLGEGSNFFVRLLNMFLGVFKWVLGVVVLIPLIRYDFRFPGESSFIDRDRTKWEYNKPRLDQSGETDNAIQSTASLIERHQFAAFEHDSEQSSEPNDLMSLHSIDETAHPQFSFKTTTTVNDDVTERHLGPRYLCFLDKSQPRGYVTRSTSDWARHHGTSYPDYVFVSYTRLQFYTTIAGDPSLPADMNVRLQAAADQDMKTLIEYAIKATKAAHIDAFWIDYECVQPEAEESADRSMEDVYRICDIVRACHSMAIIVGPRFNYTNYIHEIESSASAKAEWLQDWGSRLWTVPEALLCPGEHRISVYVPGASEPELVAKRNLPARVWDDAPALRQLIDHYESSIHLTKLELITIALECLQRRQTEKRMGGDVAYALQGLLRQRPRVIDTDTDFQAFARLSLANSSDMLLERMICLKLTDNRAPWHDMQDVWGAKLWDVSPICQVEDIAEDNTVILVDAKGATVNWSYLEAVDYDLVRPRSKFWGFVRLGPALCLSALYIGTFFSIFFNVVQIIAHDVDSFASTLVSKALIAIFAISVLMSMFTPLALRHMYKDKIHTAQARFYGIAGRPDIGKAEELMFGSDQGRLQWITDASGYGDQQASTSGPEPLEHEEDADGLRAFTLIDTCTMSAIPFKAELPPSVVLACARTRGLVRMLLCSYDAPSKRLCKEAVLRLESNVLDRMPKLDKLRFTLKQPRYDRYDR